MKKTALLIATFMSSLVSNSQTFQPNWASLNTRKMPEWFGQDKFGIFIHWGIYAVPAYAPVISISGESYSEWYWHHLNGSSAATKAFSRQKLRC